MCGSSMSRRFARGALTWDRGVSAAGISTEVVKVTVGGRHCCCGGVAVAVERSRTMRWSGRAAALLG
jgi:hypothetical protein